MVFITFNTCVIIVFAVFSYLSFTSNKQLGTGLSVSHLTLQIERLAHLFKMDFDLFGYNWQDYQGKLLPTLYSRTENIIFVRLSPDRMGPLGKPPANLALLPSRARSGMRSCPAPFFRQRWYEAIRVWSYTTFIVIEACDQQETSG